jgi:ACS family glucarate transporter-like MFS transporter
MSDFKKLDPKYDPAQGRATWVRWRIVALLMALSFLSWFNRQNITTAYTEQIRHQFDISEEQIGLVGTGFFLVYAAFMTPGGWFTDRFGWRLSLGLMGIGLGVFVALTGCTGLLFTTSLSLLAALIVVRSLMGIVATPMYPAGSRTIAQWFPFNRRAGANGLVQGAAAVGMAMTPLMFGPLMKLVGWPNAFIIAGFVTGLVGLLWLWYARNRPAEHAAVSKQELILIEGGLPYYGGEQGSRLSHAPSAAWRILLRNRSLVLLTVSYAAIGYFEYLFNFWEQHYFSKVRSVEVETSRVYAMCTKFSMAAGMFLGGALATRLVRGFGVRKGLVIVPVGGMLAGAILLLIAIQVEDADWMVFWLCLSQAAVGATEGPQWTIAIELGGSQGATAAGIFNTGGNLGGSLAPYGTAFISALFGWKVGIAAAGVVLLAGLTLWLWIDPRERVPES